jgi:hypothetical protein
MKCLEIIREIRSARIGLFNTSTAISSVCRIKNFAGRAHAQRKIPGKFEGKEKEQRKKSTYEHQNFSHMIRKKKNNKIKKK